MMLQAKLWPIPEEEMRHVLRMLFAGFWAMALWGAPAGTAQQPVKIRVSWVAPVSNWASIWLEKKDLANHLGKSYTMEPVRYAGTPPMVTTGVTEVDASGLLGDGPPRTGGLVVAPSPVQ